MKAGLSYWELRLLGLLYRAVFEPGFDAFPQSSEYLVLCALALIVVAFALLMKWPFQCLARPSCLHSCGRRQSYRTRGQYPYGSRGRQRRAHLARRRGLQTPEEPQPGAWHGQHYRESRTIEDYPARRKDQTCFDRDENGASARRRCLDSNSSPCCSTTLTSSRHPPKWSISSASW